MQEFHWPGSQYALVGTTALLVLLMLPIYVRLADLFGVRRIAAVGVMGYPLCFLLFSQMTGDFHLFLAIAALQSFLAGSITAAIYSRIVAQTFDRTRELAISVAVSGPAILGAIASPLLTGFILANGWRAGYMLAATVTLALGVTGLLLMPRSVINREARQHPDGAHGATMP